MNHKKIFTSIVFAILTIIGLTFSRAIEVNFNWKIVMPIIGSAMIEYVLVYFFDIVLKMLQHRDI